MTQRDIDNAFLAKIGSPFRIGREYLTNGEKVKATSVICGIHPRVVFSDGCSRNARNGCVSSKVRHTQDIEILKEEI